MPTREQLESALINADAVGDVEAARQIANELKGMDSLGSKLAGAGDAALSVVSNVVAEPAAGLAGLGGLLNPFDDVTRDNVGDHVRQAQDLFSYDPQTQEGRDYIKKLAKVLQPVSEIIEKVEKTSGDLGYDLAGPVGGAIGKALPTALGIALGGATARSGAKGLGSIPAVSSAVPAVKNTVRAVEGPGVLARTRDRLASQEGAGDLIPRAKDAIVQPMRKKQKAALEEGAGHREGAGYRLDDKGRVRSDPVEQRAIKMDWPEGDVAWIKESSQLDRRIMLRMLDKYERGMNYRLDKMDLNNVPSVEIGGAIQARINHARKVMEDAGEKLSAEKRGLKGRYIDATDVGDEFLDLLDDMDVAYDPKTRSFNFDGSPISENKAMQAAIRKVVRILHKDGPIDARQMHNAKVEISEMLDFDKMGKGVQGTTKGKLKQLRGKINSSLRKNFKGYADANDLYSEAAGILEDLQQYTTGKGKIVDPDVSMQVIGQKSRILASNYSSSPPLADALNRLDDFVSRQGGRFREDYKALIRFDRMLNSTLGDFKEGSLQGVTESAIKTAARGNVRGGVVDVAADLAVAGVKKVKGVTPERQLQAMRELLKQQGKSRSKEVTIGDS